MGWARARAMPLLVGLCITLMAALAVCGVMLVRQTQKTKALGGRTTYAANAFWMSFLAGDAPIKIVLPTPVFFNFTDHPSFRFRSTAVNAYDQIDKDPELKALIEKLGPVGLEQSYTVTWDTLAAIEIARYLDRVGQENVFRSK